VGMGGRLDATNIIIPEISIITNISYDHKEFLGDTLKEIAHEKAGIIKKGVPVVASYQESEAMKVIEQKAIEKNSELYIYGRDFSSVLKRNDSSGICFDYSSGDSFAINNLVLPLAGEHQMQNASVAIKAATIVLNNNMVKGRDRTLISPIHRFTDSPIQEEHIIKLIRNGLAATRWPGRLEIIKEDPPMLIDGAHNPAAAMALSEAFKKIFPGKNKKIILVLGIMSDKDARGIMEPLLPLASEIILTSPAYNRSASPEKLAGIAASLGFFDVRITHTVKDAVEMAIEDSCKLQVTSYKLKDNKNSTLETHNSKLNSPLILITGSFYTIGEAKEVLGQKGTLARLRE